MSNLTKKIVAVITTLTVSVWMLGPGVAHALTAAELQAQIDALLAQIAQLQTQLATLEGEETAGGAIVGVPADFTFETALKQGDSGVAVKYLQIVLNSDSATQLAASGVGSAGNETEFFGPLTKAAVIKFQEKYADDVLASWGLTSGTGFVGSTTRAKLNELLSAGVTKEVTEEVTEEEKVAEEVVSVGPAKVELAADTPGAKQIALNAQNGLAAKFKFSGGDDGFTVTKIVVKRGGVSADADVSAIKLYDGTKQIGSSQALNTNTHKATFSSLSWQVPAGEVKYLTMKVSIAAKGTATVGDSIKLGLVSASDIVTSQGVTLEGDFPMYGNAITIAGISVGELFVTSRSTPATNTALLSGSTEQEIASWAFQASSTEAVEVHSIKVTHVGTASRNDVTNIKLKISGTQIGNTMASFDSENAVEFDLSADPVSILAGSTKNIYAYADISSGIWTARTVKFEITQSTDVTVYGANSGGAIEPSETDSAAWVKATGNQMTISQGSLTVTEDGALSPATQSYVVGTSNRLIAAFKFTAGSEEGVRLVKLRLKNNGTGGATDISNVTLWDGSTQVAGPASLVGSYVTFGANTVGWDATGLFDLAKSAVKTIQVKADVPTGATTGTGVIDLDINANTDIWIDGLESQYDIDQGSITLSDGNTVAHDVAAKGTLAVAASANAPAAQTYIKGATAKEFLRVDLNAGSGENVIVSSMTFYCDKDTSGTACASGDFTNAKLYDVGTGAQLGSTVASPTNQAAFSFSLTVPASGTKTLKLMADLPSNTGATGADWELNAAGDIDSEGSASAATITETGFAVQGNTMTIGEGSLTVSAGASPGDQNLIIGSSQIPIVALNFVAGSAENVRVTKVKLTGSAGKSIADITNDLSNIALYDGATILTAKRVWDSNASTVTFTASDFLNGLGFDINKGQQKTITVKADLPSTGAAEDLVALGIATSTNETAGTAGFAETTTTDISFTGLDSNSTPAANMSFDTNLDGVNYSEQERNRTEVHYTTLKSKGGLDANVAADTPDKQIVAVGPYTAGKTGVVMLKVDIKADLEAVDIKSVEVERKWGTSTYDKLFGPITLWDTTTQIGNSQGQNLIFSGHANKNSSTTFNLPAGSYWRIPAGETKVLTVKADLKGILDKNNTGYAETGAASALCVAGYRSAFMKIQGVGVSSGETIWASSTLSTESDLCGEFVVPRKSKPTIAAASLPSTAFDAATKVLYRWTVTADSSGSIGWRKVVFDVSGSVQSADGGGTLRSRTIGYGGGTSTTTDGIYMSTNSSAGNGLALNVQLIATSTMKVYKSTGTGWEQVNATTGVFSSVTAGSPYVWNYETGGARVVFIANNEQVIAAGQTVTYELRGDILVGGGAGDSVSFKMEGRSTATTTDLFKIAAGSVATNEPEYSTSTAATFIWTDRSGGYGSGEDHSIDSKDWTNDYEVDGLPTATLTLSK